MPIKTIIVTGGDAHYYPYVKSLISSINRLSLSHYTLGIIDGGFTNEQVVELRNFSDHIVTPDWDNPQLKRKSRSRQYLLVNIQKPRLNTLFPNFDLIIWLDADAWLQTADVLNHLEVVAMQDQLAIVSQASRLQQHHMAHKKKFFSLAFEPRNILYKNAKRAKLPRREVQSMLARPTLNAGVYALPAQSRHWDTWSKRQQQCLESKCRVFTVDQLSLGLAVYIDKMNYEALPDICNYMGPWRYDTERKMFTDFFYPYDPVSVIHMAGHNKENDGVTRAFTQTGAEIEVSLHYNKWFFEKNNE